MSDTLASQLTGELDTILTSGAFSPVSDRAFLRITGPDAPRWLNGMVTNNIQALQPGEGTYNYLLNSQGRIQGDCTIYREHAAAADDDATFLLETDKPQIDTIQQLLDKFIIMDDVELVRADFEHGLLALGPATQVLSPFAQTPASQDLLPLRLYDASSAPATTPSPGLVPQLHVAYQTSEDLAQATKALQSSGALQVSSETLEALRILEARPRYGTDIRNTDSAKDLPQETNQPHALHFAKGCYLGQEIVERIRSRGQVHRLFTPFRLDGPLPATFPVPLEANGKPAGELTSGVTLQTTAGPISLALGYARREALDAHAPLTYPGGTAHPRSAGKLS